MQRGFRRKFLENTGQEKGKLLLPTLNLGAAYLERSLVKDRGEKLQVNTNNPPFPPLTNTGLCQTLPRSATSSVCTIQSLEEKVYVYQRF